MVIAGFGTDSIESIHFLRALAQYQRTLVSSGARADKEILLTQQERFGKQLFMQACASCHAPPFYTDFNYHRVYKTPKTPFHPLQNILNGRFRITQNLGDLSAYKTPSLRNVALTYPYMHDAGVPNLFDCLSHGTVQIDTLSKEKGLPSNQIKQALVSYLEALTDSVYTKK
jgi:cytochrome c peroxidase